MKLSLAILAVAVAPAAAGKTKKQHKQLSTADIKATSKTGNRILSKARRLEGGEEATTWVAGYSLKFHSCSANENFYGGWFAGDNQDAQANYNYYGGDNANGNYYQQGDGNNNQYNANAYGDGNNQYNNYQGAQANYNYYGGDNANGNYYQQGDGNNNQYNANAYGDGNNQYNNYQGGNGYYNGEQRNDYQGMYQEKLVHFKLCPSNTCSGWGGCKNGADYVIGLNDYVDAVLEAKMTAQEYKCEKIRENCYCENANSEESCQYNCFVNAKQTDCAEAMYEDEFDVQEAVECVALEVDEDEMKTYFYNNRAATQQANGYNMQNGEQQEIEKLYVGPYCAANGKNIFLGVFTEETCSYPAPKGIYSALHYGEDLPYSKKGMIDSGCISCKEPTEVDYNNYWDQQDPDEVTDVCANLYEQSGKCEEGLTGYVPYRDNYGCNFIKSMKSPNVLSTRNNVPAKVFAGIFAATTAILAGVAAVLFKRQRRQNVSLVGTDAIIA